MVERFPGSLEIQFSGASVDANGEVTFNDEVERHDGDGLQMSGREQGCNCGNETNARACVRCADTVCDECDWPHVGQQDQDRTRVNTTLALATPY